MNTTKNTPAKHSSPFVMDEGAPLMPAGQRLSFNLSCDDVRGRRRAPSPPSSTTSEEENEVQAAERGTASIHPFASPSKKSSIPKRSNRFGSESQEELVHACLDGKDEEAFRRLHDRYRTAIQRICMRVTGNAQDAEDAAQDTFLVVHEKLSTFRFQSRFSSWIFRIAYNKAVELRRARRRTNPRRRGFDVSDPADGLESIVDYRRPGIPEELCELESCERIAGAVHSLSPRLRKAAAMRYLGELSYKEIGERLAIPIGTVRSRLSRARESVRIANAS